MKKVEETSDLWIQNFPSETEMQLTDDTTKGKLGLFNLFRLKKKGDSSPTFFNRLPPSSQISWLLFFLNLV